MRRIATSLSAIAVLLILACTLKVYPTINVCDSETPCIQCVADDAGAGCAVIVNGSIPVVVP